MSRRALTAAALVGGLAFSLHTEPSAQSQDRLAPWAPGTLEVHQISTGVGNAALAVFPDGTTLLIDAGDLDAPASIRRPNATRRAGEWVARYVQNALRHDPNPRLDHVLLTHLHGDHIGQARPDSPVGAGGYKLAGISDVAEFLPIGHLLDRGWPNYDYPSPIAGIEEYRKFITWQSANHHVPIEQVKAGRSDQIGLVRDPGRYPSFEVRNIAANGEVWTGIGANSRSVFPALQTLAPSDYPTENSCSAAIKITYGAFTLFAGGDLTGEPPPGGASWMDVESAIAPLVGAVDVAVLNHHGMGDASNTAFLAELQPRVVVVPASYPPHPDFDTVLRITSPRLWAGPRDIFATSILPATRTVLGSRLNEFKSAQVTSPPKTTAAAPRGR